MFEIYFDNKSINECSILNFMSLVLLQDLCILHAMHFFFAFYSVDKLYLFKEYAKFSGKSSKAKGGSRQTVNNDSSSGTRSIRGRQKDAQEKDDNKSNKDDIQMRKIVEAEAREEGEISESEAETKYRLDKEEKWLEWCSEVLDEEQETLKRLDRLQNTSVNLPKEKVFAFSVQYILKTALPPKSYL